MALYAAIVAILVAFVIGAVTLARRLGQLPIGRRYPMRSLVALVTMLSITFASTRVPALFFVVGLPLFVLCSLWLLTGLLGASEKPVAADSNATAEGPLLSHAATPEEAGNTEYPRGSRQQS